MDVVEESHSSYSPSTFAHVVFDKYKIHLKIFKFKNKNDYATIILKHLQIPKNCKEIVCL